MCNNSVLIFVFIITLFSKIINAQDDRKHDFRLSFATKYLSRFTTYGIDLANESAGYGLSGSLSHNSGFYTDIYFTNPLDSDSDARQTTLDIGYEKEFSDLITFSAEFNQYFYSSDTINILSQFSNSVSLNTELNFNIFDLGFSYDRFLGNGGASYFSFDVSTFQEIGPFYILPLYQAVFLSQSVTSDFLLKTKGKKKKDNTLVQSTEISGLANSIITVAAIYPVMQNLSVSFTPSVIMNHNEELSSKSFLFIWNAGLRYRFKF